METNDQKEFNDISKSTSSFWESALKIGQLAQLLVTIALAIFTFQLKLKIDEIGVATQKVDLAKKLMSELTSKEKNEKTKQDIALIILNRTLSTQDGNSALIVAEIAEQVYKEKLTSLIKDISSGNNRNCTLEDLSDFPTSVVAFRIIEEHQPDRAKALLKNFGKNIKNKIELNKNIGQRECLNKLEKYFSFNSVIWIQFNQEYKRNKINLFANKLRDIGWKVPSDKNNITGESKKTGYTYDYEREKFKTTIRYFHPMDRERAERVKKVADEFFNMNFELEDLFLQSSFEPFGQIEIWINFP